MEGSSIRCGLGAARDGELLLPLEDAGTGGGGFSLLNVAGVLKGDGQSGVGQRVLRREDGEGHCGCYGVVGLAGIAEGSNEAVMGFDVCGIGGDGGAKGLCGFLGFSGGQQLKGDVGERVGGGCVCHGWFQDKGRAGGAFLRLRRDAEDRCFSLRNG